MLLSNFSRVSMIYKWENKKFHKLLVTTDPAKQSEYQELTWNILHTYNGNVVSIKQNLVKLCYSAPFRSNFTANYQQRRVRLDQKQNLVNSGIRKVVVQNDKFHKRHTASIPMFLYLVMGVVLKRKITDKYAK